ncbi:high mobility group box domain-containing protein, partial [Cantharellus anzutake]|uniref:high mobility group box domain-containing protein n=1 Tax=Cantharellus anzutake TaxID=1750568 RepID=UPI001907AB00
HIPRPPNCFLLYRSWVRQQNKLYGKGDHQKKNEQNVSVIVGTLWEDLPEEKKEIFRAEARRLKEEHMQRYPGYKYAP